jgi:SET domain-containing protein
MAYSTVAKNSIGTKDEMRLFVAASFVNHSCDFNTIYPFNESTQKLMFQAARPIKAGQEITISYVGNGDYDSRQRVLRMVYGFDCTCTKCLIEADGIKKKKKKTSIGKKI